MAVVRVGLWISSTWGTSPRRLRAVIIGPGVLLLVVILAVAVAAVVTRFEGKDHEGGGR
jgi:hypothetical protein